jgi:hypothetical protein
MGKKTLEEIIKLFLVSVISIIATTIITSRTLIDRKLDKNEYLQDQEEKWEEHQRQHNDMKEYIGTRFEDLKDFIKENNE